MNPVVLELACASAPDVLERLIMVGLDDLIVSSEPVIWVRSDVHGLPVPLHDVDDVRWFAADVQRSDRTLEPALP